MDADTVLDDRTQVLQRLNNLSRTQRWEFLKEEIRTLYMIENQKLSATMATIEQLYDFSASERTWKSKLKQWGFEKNLPEHDMKILVAKADKGHREENKDTQFLYKGNIIPQEKIENFKRRKVVKDSDPVSPSAATPSEVIYHTPGPSNCAPSDASMIESTRTEEEESEHVYVAQTGAQFPGHQQSNVIAMNEPDLRLSGNTVQPELSLAFPTQKQIRTVLGIPQENEVYIGNSSPRTIRHGTQQLVLSIPDMRNNLINNDLGQTGRHPSRQIDPKLESLLKTINGTDQGGHTSMSQHQHHAGQGLSRTSASVGSRTAIPDQHEQQHQMAVQIYGISNEVLLEVSSNTRILPMEGIRLGQTAHTVSGGTIHDDEQDRRSTSTRSYARGVTYPGYAESEITGISQSEFFVAELFSRGWQRTGAGVDPTMYLNHDILDAFTP